AVFRTYTAGVRIGRVDAADGKANVVDDRVELIGWDDRANALFDMVELGRRAFHARADGRTDMHADHAGIHGREELLTEEWRKPEGHNDDRHEADDENALV